FASDLDETTRKQIERGQRMTELLKQPQYSPMSVGQIAISLFVADQGDLDDVELKKISDFESALQSYVASQHPELLQLINEKPELSEEVKTQLKAIVAKFKNTQTW